MLYELRIYHSSPTKLPLLHNRFQNHTLKLWEKFGIRQVGFWTQMIGDNNQDLYYIIAWENLAEREKKWRAFMADPDWALVGTREPYVDARLADLLPGASSSRMHVIVRIARPLEADAGPDAGLEVLIVLGQASGTGGSSRTIEVAIVREELPDPGNPPQIRVLRWREVT